MEQLKDKLPKFTEFETKYRVELDKQPLFKDLVESLEGLKEFVYVQGPDVYWTKGEDNFQRYRKAEHDKSGKAWLTNKFKTEDSNNNNRVEHNIRIDHTPYEEVKSYVESMGYEYNFKIIKYCHIYKFKDATLVFYLVKDEKKNRECFIEIEVDEATIEKYTEEEAWDVIRKYENIMSPLGIKPQNRLRKSLFEMYRK